MPFPSCSHSLEAKVLGPRAIPFHMQEACFPVEILFEFGESGTMHLSSNFSGLSHYFSHANKTAALKL